MKTILMLVVVFALVLIPVTESFAEESFNGYSSIDPPLSEIVAGQSTGMNIRFLYTSGPYALNNFTPIIDVNPSSVRQFVQVEVDSIEITQGQIKRIPVILTVDSHIEHEKIFLSISYAGHHFQSGELQKSSWNDQIELDVKGRLVPEPEQYKGTTTHWNCGSGTTLQDGMCVVEKSQNVTANSSGMWGGVVDYPAHRTGIENINGTFYYMSEPFELNSNLPTISFHNVLFTSPYTTTPPRYIYSDVTFFDGTEDTLQVIFTYPDFTEHTKPQAGFIATSDGYHFLVSVNLEEMPPLKQIKNGIALFDVICSENKMPAYKNDNMSVACVTEETHSELIHRGWALLRFTMPDENPSNVLCNRYDGKWHPEYNGCRGDISDLQCSLMGGKFVDNLNICYNDICPENKTYTLCVVNSDKSDFNEYVPEPAPASTQCRPGLPTFTSNFYLDKELCKWKLIPEPIPDEAIPYVWNGYLQKRQIDFSPKEVSYFNFGEGFDPENENKVCSPIILTDKTELYISSTFTIEPFEIIDTVTNKTHPDDCYKIWKTETLLVEPSPELGAWLKNYWEKENED